MENSGLISFSEPEGYSTSEISAITSFVSRGGTVIVLDDFGYSSGIADEVGISYSNHRLYDDEYAIELDYNYVWMNISQTHTDWEDVDYNISNMAWISKDLHKFITESREIINDINKKFTGEGAIITKSDLAPLRKIMQ